MTFAYRAGAPVLRDISVELQPGRVVGLFGPNGSGKSTLLRCLNGSLRPQQGCVTLEGRRVDLMSPRKVARLIAVVPQETALGVPLTAAEMVMLGRYAHWDFWGEETSEDRQAVADSLARVGAYDLAQRPFDQLSGGERQRVVIARALAQRGRVLLLDEPATHLDISHQLGLYRLLRGLADEGQAVLVVCHDLFIAPMFVDYAALLHSGRVYAVGPVNESLSSDNLAAVYGSRLTISWANRSSVSAAFA